MYYISFDVFYKNYKIKFDDKYVVYSKRGNGFIWFEIDFVKGY